MSKKLDKKLQRYLKRHKTPKEIAGVKVPKSLRRAADSPLGAALIAHLLAGRASGDTSKAAKLLHEVDALAGSIGEVLATPRTSARNTIADPEGSKTKKRPRSRAPLPREITH